MRFDYNYDYSYPDPFVDSAVGGVFGAVFGFLMVFYWLMLAFSVVTYVLQSLGFYSIAKRRGIHNPWLAWLPVGNMWILGSISDQYQYVVKGRVRNRRKTLMGLSIAMLASVIPMYIGVFFSIVLEAAAADADETILGATIGIMVIVCLLIAIVGVIAVVLQYMSLYDLYVSCEPGNSVLYLVLSIFVSVTMPFFIFLSRKKDLGMPPRKTAQPQQPAIQAVETVEEETPEDIQSQEEQE